MANLFGDIVDGVEAQPGVGLYESMRADHHVHQSRPYTTLPFHGHAGELLGHPLNAMLRHAATLATIHSLHSKTNSPK